jgi:hypothetical protein
VRTRRLAASSSQRQKSRASTRVARFHGTRIAHKNRNHRSRSIPYERTVAAARPVACKSAKNADTASTGVPAGSTSRNGNHGSSVPSSAPANGTANTARSLDRCSSLSTRRGVAPSEAIAR